MTNFVFKERWVKKIICDHTRILIIIIYLSLAEISLVVTFNKNRWPFSLLLDAKFVVLITDDCKRKVYFFVLANIILSLVFYLKERCGNCQMNETSSKYNTSILLSEKDCLKLEISLSSVDV